MRRKLSVLLISVGLLVGAATPAFAHTQVCPPGSGGSQNIGNATALVGLAQASAAGAPIVLHPTSC